MSEKTSAQAGQAGTIDVGGDLTVNRLGFGAMRITGRGIWGEPADRTVAKAVLRRAVGDLLPEAVRERVDKMGVATPEAEWLRGPLGAFAQEVFASPEFCERGFLDARAVGERLRRHRAGERSTKRTAQEKRSPCLGAGGAPPAGAFRPRCS